MAVAKLTGTRITLSRKHGESLISSIRTSFPLICVFVFCIGIMAIALLSNIQSMGLRRYLLSTDFRAYYTSGRMLLGGVSGNFYDLTTQYSWQQNFAPEMSELSQLMLFAYPPFVAAMLAPAAIFPLDSAFFIWMSVNIVLLAKISQLFSEAVGGGTKRVKFYALAIGLTFLPVWVTVMQGQISFILTLAMMLSWRSLKNGRDMRAGLWLALLLMKPQLILVPALFLAWQKRFRALVGLLFGGMAALLISFLAVGYDGLQGYVKMLISAFSWGDAYGIHPQLMHTWRGFLNLLFATDNAADVQIWWLLGAAFGVGLMLYVCRVSGANQIESFDLQWAVLVVVTLLASPHAYFHDLSLLLVPGVLVLRYLITRWQDWRSDWALMVLLFLGHLTIPFSLFRSPGLRLQPSVLFMLLALIVLGWKLAGSGRRSMGARRC